MIALAIGIVLSLIAWSTFGHEKTSDELPIFTSFQQYQDAIDQAQKLSLKHLQSYDSGNPMDEREKQDLAAAARLLDACAAYRPTNIALYLGAGKCYQAMGDDVTAVKRLQQGIAVTGPGFMDPAIKDTLVESYYVLSVSLFNLHQYDAALQEINAAIKMYGSPIYRTRRASIYVEQHRYKEAVQDLVGSMNLDPNYRPAQKLLKLLALTQDSYRDTAKQKLNAKDYRATVEACNKGLDIGLEDPILRALRAAACIELGDKKQAKVDVDILLKHDPTDKNALLLNARLK